MMELATVILAAATEAAGDPTALQTWGPWGAVIVALGGKEGVVALIALLRGKTRNGSGGYNKKLCERLHAEIDEDRKNTRQDTVYMRKQIDRIVMHLHIPDDD